jgi:hypothetical protein
MKTGTNAEQMIVLFEYLRNLLTLIIYEEDPA